MDDEYTVGVAADLSGVSVRTLHYYDQIGLVRPSSRSPAGYRQHELIEQSIARHQAMLAVIDKELDARAAGIALTPRQRREVFGGDRLLDHVDDARRTWGDTPEFVQRQERTARYGPRDWTRLRAELAGINQGLAEAMARGVPATDPIATDLAERLRKHTHRWFHDCDHETHREMAEYYRANSRSGRNYDDMVPGLSRYVSDAIIANCDNALSRGA